MTVNLITEDRPHISDVGTTFLILVVAHWQVNFGPVAHKSRLVVAFYKWLLIAVDFGYKKHWETQNVVGNDR